MENQEKLFELKKEKKKPIPGHALGRTHRPDFEDLLDAPTESAVETKTEDFGGDGHLKPEFHEKFNIMDFKKSLSPERYSAAMAHYNHCDSCYQARERLKQSQSVQ